jgi:DNA-binding MarR family transcriptional regulator
VPVRAARNLKPAGDDAQRRGELETLNRLSALASEWERALPGVEGDAVAFFAHLNVLANFARRAMEGWLRPHGLVYSEYRVLSVLLTQEGGAGLTPAALQAVAGMTSAGMTRALTRLESAGYIERRPNPADGRSTLVRLSPAGEEFAETVCRAIARTYAEALAPVDARRRGEQLEVLGELIRFVGARREAT